MVRPPAVLDVPGMLFQRGCGESEVNQDERLDQMVLEVPCTMVFHDYMILW